MFKVTKSGHGMYCIQGIVTRSQGRTIRGIVLNNWIESDDYKLSRACGAFLQGYEEDSNGETWILVEFWNNGKEEIDAFVKHVNNLI